MILVPCFMADTPARAKKRSSYNKSIGRLAVLHHYDSQKCRGCCQSPCCMFSPAHTKDQLSSLFPNTPSSRNAILRATSRSPLREQLRRMEYQMPARSAPESVGADRLVALTFACIRVIDQYRFRAAWMPALFSDNRATLGVGAPDFLNYGIVQLYTDKVSFGFDGGFGCCALFTNDRKIVPFIAWKINACHSYEDERMQLPCLITHVAFNSMTTSDRLVAESTKISELRRAAQDISR